MSHPNNSSGLSDADIAPIISRRTDTRQIIPRPGVKGGLNVAVEEVGEKYRCNICGNEVTVTHAGGGTLVCCGKDMEKIN